MPNYVTLTLCDLDILGGGIFFAFTHQCFWSWLPTVTIFLHYYDPKDTDSYYNSANEPLISMI